MTVRIGELYIGVKTDQLFYAAAAGFLLVAVLIASKSIIPCMITHSMLNALSTFSNETALDKIQIPVSIVLCVIAGVSAYLVFRNYKREKLGGVG